MTDFDDPFNDPFDANALAECLGTALRERTADLRFVSSASAAAAVRDGYRLRRRRGLVAGVATVASLVVAVGVGAAVAPRVLPDNVTVGPASNRTVTVRAQVRHEPVLALRTGSDWQMLWVDESQYPGRLLVTTLPVEGTPNPASVVDGAAFIDVDLSLDIPKTQPARFLLPDLAAEPTMVTVPLDGSTRTFVGLLSFDAADAPTNATVVTRAGATAPTTAAIWTTDVPGHAVLVVRSADPESLVSFEVSNERGDVLASGEFDGSSAQRAWETPRAEGGNR